MAVLIPDEKMIHFLACKIIWTSIKGIKVAITKVNVNIDIYGEKEGDNTLEVCGARLRYCGTY